MKYYVISQIWSGDRGYDEVSVVPKTWYGWMVKQFYAFLDRHERAILNYDIEKLGIEEGETIPWYSLSYFALYVPRAFANKFFPRMDGQTVRNDRRLGH